MKHVVLVYGRVEFPVLKEYNSNLNYLSMAYFKLKYINTDGKRNSGVRQKDVINIFYVYNMQKTLTSSLIN